MNLPLRIDADLTVRLGAEVARLTPGQALRTAEQLIRKGTRRMMVEEALVPAASRRPQAGRRASR